MSDKPRTIKVVGTTLVGPDDVAYNDAESFIELEPVLDLVAFYIGARSSYTMSEDAEAVVEALLREHGRLK